MRCNPEHGPPKFAMSRRGLLINLGVLAVAAHVGDRFFVPAARAQSAGGVFVGKVDGTNAFVGVVTDGQQAEAYVCDGRAFKELFTGSLADASNGRLTLMGEDGDLLPIDVDQNSLPTLLATGAALTGALTVGASTHTVHADPASGPGALYLSIGTLADGSVMDGGTVVLNSGEFRGILDAIVDYGGQVLGALAEGYEAAETYEETGDTPQGPGTIGLGEVISAGITALTGDTQGAVNILNGCGSPDADPVLCPEASTANVNSAPLFSVSMKAAANGGATPSGGATATPTIAGRGAGGPAATPTTGARVAATNPPAAGGGASSGSPPQLNQQPIAQAMKMMQSGQALSGPNGPQPVPVPVTVGATTVNAAMVPQTPGQLAQNGPPH
jgi:hypothetical protein